MNDTQATGWNQQKVSLREGFAAPDNAYRPVPFYHLDGDISKYDVVYTEIRNNRRVGYGGMAILPVRETLPKGFSEEYFTALRHMLDQLRELGMTAIFYDDVDFPSGHAGGRLLKKYPDAQCKEINSYEFSNQSGAIELTVALNRERKEKILSVVAMGEDKHLIDITGGVDGDTVRCSLPDGTYTVYAFTCQAYSFHERVDFLNYGDSQKFIDMTYNEMVRRFPEHMGSTIKMSFYDDVSYWARNGRVWQYDMKERFIEKYGMDPTPYYPALVTDIGEDTMWFRAAFMSLRAKLYSEGFFKAVGEWGEKNGIITTGHVAGPGNPDTTNSSGDLMLIQKHVGAAGQDSIHGYMYSLTAYKMTSSSAYNFDKKLVMSEIYGNYPENSGVSVLYSEAMHAFTKGLNYLIPHGIWYKETARIPPQLSYKSPIYGPGLPDYTTFVARCQYLLQGGRHVADIGLLYPIRSLEAQSTLHDYDSAFQRNPPPQNADFMNVINVIVNYCNKDLTVLHPETINERMTVEGNELKLCNPHNFESYKVFVIPSGVMIELSNLKKIEAFYDNGGKVIATGILPYKSYEKGKDAEVCAIVEKMFGTPVGYSERCNQNGGKTYYVPANGKTIQGGQIRGGCDTVEPDVMYAVLEDALSVYDVKIRDKLAIDNHGYFNYIHKVKDGVDVYYFGNASNTPIDTYAELRGRILPELWDPMNASMKTAEYDYVTRDGVDITRVKLTLDAVQSVFVIDVSNVRNNTVLFEDDFSNGTAKWSAPQPVSDGNLQVSTPISAIGTRGLCDFTLNVKMDATKEAQILFRRLDEGDGYNWTFENKDGRIVLTPRVLLNHQETRLTAVETGIEATDGVEVTVVCVRDEIRTYVNQQPVGVIRDATNRYGEVGLGSGSFAAVSVEIPAE